MSRPDRRLAPYIFFNLKGGRQQQADGSYSLYNKYEAAFCAQLLAALHLSAERWAERWGREGLGGGASGSRPFSPADMEEVEHDRDLDRNGQSVPSLRPRHRTDTGTETTCKNEPH